MALITAAQFRQHFPALTGTTEDATLDLLVARADDLMAAWAGYPPYDGGAGAHTLEDVAYTLRLSAPAPADPRVLCLCVQPIVSITSVKVDATGFFSGSETTLASGTDFVLDAEAGEDRMPVLLRADGYTWPVGYHGIRVVLTAGYATTPPGLVALAAMEVRHLWNLRNTQGESALTFRGDSAQLEDWERVIPLAVQEGLAAYRTCA